MSWRLDVRPAALADIHSAAAWYEEHENGLGAEFARTIRKAIKGLAVDPLLYRVRHSRWRARWFSPPRFPYQIVYRTDEDVVTVIAVLHAARHEREWIKRL